MVIFYYFFFRIFFFKTFEGSNDHFWIGSIVDIRSTFNSEREFGCRTACCGAVVYTSTFWYEKNESEERMKKGIREG